MSELRNWLTYFFGYAGTVKSSIRGCTVSATPLRKTRSAGFAQ